MSLNHLQRSAEKRAIGSISKRISEIRAHKVAFDAVLQDENSTVRKSHL